MIAYKTFAEHFRADIQRLESEDDNSRANESGAIDSVFSSGFSSATCSKMYQAWVVPDLFPDEPQPRLENWPAEDLEAFCGIYQK